MLQQEREEREAQMNAQPEEDEDYAALAGLIGEQTGN